MRKIFALALVSFFVYKAGAQGCVAIRSNGATCTMTDADHMASHDDGKDWILSLNYRYFKSYKHFVGTVEQKQRVEEGTEVENYVNATDIDLIRVLNNRWSLGLFTPVLSNVRSSLYEHDGKTRHQTHSFGVGDIRLAAYYWLLDPVKNKKGNIQVGLGLKLPTGDYRYQDWFYKNDSTHVLGPVDQSIQLGDGGTGITLEVNAFYHFNHALGVYGNFYYLSNPREQNGVSTARGGTPSPSTIAYGMDVMSVPDQYMVRGGADVRAGNFTLSGGVRMECVPVYDLIGGSNGFRRPGYVISAEPVVSYKAHKVNMYISMPWAFVRNRTQSVPDKIRTTKTGVHYQGDAAFADYTINAGIAFSLK
jgi:hypothetical protein